MLRTEKDTPAMGARVEAAFKAQRGRAGNAVFEHGHWWIDVPETGAQYNVVDASGGDSVDGFDFEQVSDGDEA